ncbi:hypothetical protein GCM10027442_38800 [Emticicia fontis]
MAAFELDSTMLKKIDKLHRACTTLNTMESDLKASYQINDERILIVLFKHHWDFTIWSYQRRFIQLTYADLDQALEEFQAYETRFK